MSEIAITTADLEKPLRRLFVGEVRVLHFEVTVMDYLSYSASTVGIFSVEGHVEIVKAKRARQFSLVAKIAKPASEGGGYRRESFVYDRILSRIDSPDGLRWPQFLGVNRLSNDQRVIWLERLSGSPGARWTLDDWGRFAGKLAEFQTAALRWNGNAVDSIIPNDLSDWVENDRGRYFPGILEETSVVGDLLTRDHFENAKWLWAHRHSLLNKLDALPQTICHNDLWSGNVLKDEGGNDGFMLLDWELADRGPLGADLAFAVLADIWLLVGSVKEPTQLANALLNGYLRGLIVNGDEHSSENARVAFQITAALRWTLMIAQLILDAKDPERIAELVRSERTTASYIMKQRARLVRAGCEMVRGLNVT